MNNMPSPELTFNPADLWCSHHASPWRTTWPGGGMMVATIELTMTMMHILEDAVVDADYSKISDLTPEQMGIWIKLLQPCCCWLEAFAPEKLVAVYKKAETKNPGLNLPLPPI